MLYCEDYMETRTFDIFTPTKEHEMLRHYARRFAVDELEPGAAARDENESFDLKLFRRLGELGFLGLTAPMEYGGSGMDATAAVLVHEELSSVDPGFTLAFLAHSMLTVNNIAQNCNEEQKSRYLPKLCSGEWIGAMAMSEPEAGTDVLGMCTSAQKTANGYVINGRKMWITNGAIDDNGTSADVLFLYAKIPSLNKKNTLSSFIIEAGNEGYSVGFSSNNDFTESLRSKRALIFDCVCPSLGRRKACSKGTLSLKANFEANIDGRSKPRHARLAQ
jgi:isovaleryl-CoA dehydrogenase